VAAPSKAWVCGRSLAGTVGLWPLACWDCGSVAARLLRLWVCGRSLAETVGSSGVCCQVEVFATGRSPVQRSHECVCVSVCVCFCVIECDQMQQEPSAPAVSWQKKSD